MFLIDSEPNDNLFRLIAKTIHRVWKSGNLKRRIRNCGVALNCVGRVDGSILQLKVPKSPRNHSRSSDAVSQEDLTCCSYSGIEIIKKVTFF